MFHLNRIIVVAIILSLGHVPMPWGHTHDGLQGAALTKHLQQCHNPVEQSHSPDGWHWHFLGTTDRDTLATEDSSKSRSQGASDMPLAFPWAMVAGPLSPSAPGRFFSQANHQRPIYLRLEVLLI